MHNISNVANLFRILDNLVRAEFKAEILALEEQELYKLHFGLNGLIRSLAYYKNESAEGKEYFQSLGLPDDGSSIIGAIYWMHLRNELMTVPVVSLLIERRGLFIFEEEARSLAAKLVSDYAKYKSGNENDI